ncbi:MAG: hypothetical protein K8U03_07155 [Planctomycetia bacterium]|nr:hypothetical protein [Planctomycetia bacterium]
MTLHVTLRFGVANTCRLLIGIGLFSVGLFDATPRTAEASDYFHTDACAEQRAGYPQQVKPIATHSNTRHYGGYYVGGGSTFFAGHERRIDQGTWGWDYCGILKNNWIKLGWNHGNRPQGGTGSYKTNFAPFQ